MSESYLHLAVLVCVSGEEVLDGIGLIWKLDLSQLCAKGLQQLGYLLYCHCKSLNSLQRFPADAKIKLPCNYFRHSVITGMNLSIHHV